MPNRSRTYRAQTKATDEKRKSPQPLGEAIKTLKEMVEAKGKEANTGKRKRKGFDQTVELVMHLGIDPRQADQMIRGSLSLPKGIGASKKVIAFCADDMVEEAKAAGAVEAGGDELVKKVTDGWTDFDVAVAHPSVMSKVGKLGRVLGPQGKMPSPKSGTVTPEIAQAVKDYSAGKLEYRNDSGGNVHAVVGKISFTDEDLHDNLDAFITHIRKSRPAAAKGQFIKRVCISATMTPSVDVEVA